MASHCTPVGLLSFGEDKGLLRKQRKSVSTHNFTIRFVLTTDGIVLSRGSGRINRIHRMMTPRVAAILNGRLPLASCRRASCALNLLWVEIGYRPVSFLPLALPPPEGRRLDSSSAEKSVAGLGRVRCDWGVVFFATPMIPAGRAGHRLCFIVTSRPSSSVRCSFFHGHWVTLFIVGAHSSSRRNLCGWSG